MSKSDKNSKVLRRKIRTKAKISRKANRLRASVLRSAKYIYVQIIDDTKGTTIVAVNSKDEKDLKGKPVDVAKEVGKKAGKLALEKGIKEIVFDRGQYRYHGRVKALAEGMREAGLNF